MTDTLMNLEIAAYFAGGDVTIEAVEQSDGSLKWAVRNGGRSILNKLGEWEREPMPSSRDDAFIERCRYATAIEAWEALKAKRESAQPSA